MPLKTLNCSVTSSTRGEAIQRFSAGKSFDDYSGDLMLRSAVERQFEIIGEALKRLTELDADLAARISERRTIIGFRNFIAHGYDVVDDSIVWGCARAPASGTGGGAGAAGGA
ncbi:MAG: DUF86 domain-containing protein [Hyphomicrobiales bacterium]|nr:DUF86 domain-containing protein [Hyphomicrobiales bacterium]